MQIAKTEADVLSRMPALYCDYREFREIARLMNPELTLMREVLDRGLKNHYLLELDEYGCSRWEKLLNLSKLDNAELEDRRFRILAKHQINTPYTFRQLNVMLTNLVGADRYKLELNTKEKWLKCHIDLGAKYQMNLIVDMLENIVPLDIALDIKLLYNTHGMLRAYTHEQLRAYTHKELKERVLNGEAD